MAILVGGTFDKKALGTMNMEENGKGYTTQLMFSRQIFFLPILNQ